MGADDEQEDFEGEFGPLERRLRNMNWPDVEPGLRERCWRDFQRIVAKRRFGRSGEAPPRDDG